MYKMVNNCQIKDLDKIYDDVFGYLNTGFFVEVGAHDGFSWSNVWGLAEAGWTGICIEPIEHLAEQCFETHRNHRITTFRCALGDYNGYTDLFLGPAPTIDETIAEHDSFNLGMTDLVSQAVPVRTLNDLLFEMILPKSLDLLVVDVEGAESKVLSGFTLLHWLPKMAIIETSSVNSDMLLVENRKFIDTYFLSDERYKLLQDDGLNSIYIRKD